MAHMQPGSGGRGVENYSMYFSADPSWAHLKTVSPKLPGLRNLLLNIICLHFGVSYKGFPKLGTIFGGPSNKYYNMLGSISGSLHFGVPCENPGVQWWKQQA